MIATPLILAAALTADVATFRSAKPIWPKGRQTERNLFVGFRATFAADAGSRVTLRVTGHSVYRAFCNGEFVGYGPARAGHGFYRVDEWDLSERLHPGANVVALEVAGYNVNSYYLLDGPAFVQAEVVGEERVLASTAGAGARFVATLLPERVQKTRRYSFQRPFSEAYRLRPGHDRWRRDPSFEPVTVACETTAEKALLPRRVPYPEFHRRPAIAEVATGRFAVDPTREASWRDRALTAIGPQLGGYPESELEVVPTQELQQIRNTEHQASKRQLAPDAVRKLVSGEWRIFDLGTNLTGFLGAKVRCTEKSRLFVVFDEVLADGDVDFKRLSCANVIAYELEPGEYDLESFEPYTARYVKLLLLSGICEVSGVHLREYVNPDVWRAQFSSSDLRLNRLFAAGRETFAQNAVDVFMDCPSRERAGWLCDSFFTARVAADLSGNLLVEKNFFENFLLPPSFAHLPDGMLPMCYPADHPDGVFIPNWALWFVVQLEEYAARGGDRALVDALQEKVRKLFAYFERFHNEDGLLEKLESWVFIEWSAANRFVQDVSYPTNMLYSGALATAGRLYRVPEWTERAQEIRAAILDQSWNGRLFRDHAKRVDAELVVQPDTTEVCQYFAFFFGIVDAETHAALAKLLQEEFGPSRRTTGAHPEVHLANSFVGNMLRLEMLSEAGLCQQVLDESVDYLLYMVDRTGTLWENVDERASCNHGFASHIVRTLYRDVLGVHRLDRVERRVELRFSALELDWCEGRIPCPGGNVFVRWWRVGEAVHFRVELPAGYSLAVENRSGRDLIRDL